MHQDECYSLTGPECGLEEEHIHSDDCYTKSLICDLEEKEAHFHDINCYDKIEIPLCPLTEEADQEILICTVPEEEIHQHDEFCWITQEAETDIEADKVLICDLDEHKHSLICFSDHEADLENPDVWESTMRDVELTGVWAEDVINIADSQIGYRESKNNYIVLSDGETKKGYSRYGEWYGDAYGDWCAMFVSFCLSYAEADGMPLESNCNSWIEKFREIELYHEADQVTQHFKSEPEAESYETDVSVELLSAENIDTPDQEVVETYIPVSGDIIFFDLDEDGQADHVGLVKDLILPQLDEEVEAAAELLTEEFEADKGYRIITIEGNADDRVMEKEYDLFDSKIIGYAEMADPENSLIFADAESVTMEAVMYTDETYAELLEDGTVITVSGFIPEEAEVRAYPVQIEEEDFLWAYDISVYLPDGSVYEPLDAMEITVVPAFMYMAENDSAIQIYYLPEDGEPEAVPTSVTDEGVLFETDHFSVYAARGITWQEVKNSGELKAAAESGAANIKLMNDIQIDSMINVSGSVQINLNGKTLKATSNNALFSVKNGSELTVIDVSDLVNTADEGESAAEEGFELPEVPDSLIGNTAVAELNGSKVKLTYYITHSVIDDEYEDVGKTTETLKAYNVMSKGTIIAGNGPVFQVEGGTLNMTGGTVYGGNGYKSEGRAVRLSNNGTVNLSGGYICGFANSSMGGAVYSTGGTLNISRDVVLAGNKAKERGGAIYAENTNVKMTGGVISGNLSETEEKSPESHSQHYGGAGMYLYNCPTVISGGYLTNNVVNSSGYFDGGGAIHYGGGNHTTFTFSGGYITGNEASSGGGIRTNWQNAVTVRMTGGYICSNLARTSEGGGMSLNIQARGIIEGGYINNNHTTTQGDWGGGGVFCSVGAKLYIKNVLITDNHAGGYGGGVGGCSTGRVYICVSQGGAVYNNSAVGEHLSGSTSTKNEDWVYAYDNEIFNRNQAYQDYFCALNSVVEGRMLGGGPANWSGSADGILVQPGADDVLIASYVMGLTSDPSEESIEAAKKEAKVYFYGNTSYTHGGGILCNGYMIIGETNNLELGTRIELQGTKELLGSNGSAIEMAEKQFGFTVFDAQTNSIMATAYNDAGGNIQFKERLALKAPGTYTYYIEEVQGEDPTIIYDTSVYRVTVKVVEGKEYLFDTLEDETGKKEIYMIRYLLDSIKVEKQSGSAGTWELVNEITNINTPEDSAYKLKISSGATFTNVQNSNINISVEKVWDDDGANNRPTSVEVTLKRNGAAYGDKIILNSSNNWSYTWKNLPTSDNDGNEYTYNVVEDPVEGYLSQYEVFNSYTLDSGGYWIPAQGNIQNGKRYMILSNDLEWALKIEDGRADSVLTTNSKLDVSTKEVTIGGITYENAIDASEVPDAASFTGQYTNTNDNKRVALKNNKLDGWLLVENLADNDLKSTNGIAYSSGAWVENGMIVMGYKWELSNMSNQYVLIYDASRNIFDAVAKGQQG
ncbi:MAG: Cna B-type domain-containing protein, partial [Clostridia bacterium]|nr:Cna B-type domain-containing protein [Clostridia bacterium]